MLVLGFTANNVFTAVSESIYHNSSEPMPCTLKISKVFGNVSEFGSARLIKKWKKARYAKKDSLGNYTFAPRPGAFYGIPKHGIPTARYEDNIKIKCMYFPEFHTIILETEDPSACQDMLFAKMLEDALMGM